MVSWWVSIGKRDCNISWLEVNEFKLSRGKKLKEKIFWDL